MEPNLEPHERRERAWDALGRFWGKLGEDAPRVGKRVRVTGGRKHKGKEGEVFWHGRNPFEGRRYGSSIERAAQDAMGKWGFRVGIRTPSGEKFFTDAANVEIIKTG